MYRIFRMMVLAAAGILAACATEGTGLITKVAPKFVGHPVEQMAIQFGAPARVTEAGDLKFYEWRIGQYVTAQDKIDGRVSSGGSLSGTIDRGETEFLGCIVTGMVEGGTVIKVTTENKTGKVGNVYEFAGCLVRVDDPFTQYAPQQGE